MHDTADRIKELLPGRQQAAQIESAKIQTVLPGKWARLRKQPLEILAGGGKLASKSCNHGGVVVIPMAAQLNRLIMAMHALNGREALTVSADTVGSMSHDTRQRIRKLLLSTRRRESLLSVANVESPVSLLEQQP